MRKSTFALTVYLLVAIVFGCTEEDTKLDADRQRAVSSYTKTGVGNHTTTDKNGDANANDHDTQTAEGMSRMIRQATDEARTLLGMGQTVSFEELAGKPERLTEEMAIEYTRQALKEKGYDVSTLAPVQFRHEYPEGCTDRYLARNTIKDKENGGYVLWGTAPGGALIEDKATWIYCVNIEKKASMIECEIYHSK